jgi:hypothetical protein
LCAREASAAPKRAARLFVARFLQAAALGHHTPVWMGTGDRGWQYDVCDVKAFEKKAVLQQLLCLIPFKVHIFYLWACVGQSLKLLEMYAP